jgi:pyruvate dehydrogenase E2 component (dihydrolipoamide acetyltransferase)
MATEIVMPRLGWSMEEGTFGVWLKQDGDTVQVGDMLLSIEGDKATQDVEVFAQGILRLPPNAAKPGDVLPVGAVLAYLVNPGEAAPFAAVEKTGGGTGGQKESAAQRGEGGPSESVTVSPVSASPAAAPADGSGRRVTISPRARRAANELGVVWAQLSGSGRSGRIVERDIRAAAQAAVAAGAPTPPAPPRLTPVAQRMVREAGIDPAGLSPEMPGGRIQRKDVEAALRAQQPAGGSIDAAAPHRAGPIAGAGVPAPVSRMRQLIAQRMMESVNGTAPVTLTTEADATELVTLREHLRTVLGRRDRPAPTYNDLLIKLTAQALLQHPLLNATWQGETLQLWDAVHMGLAVDTAEGLVVPVVRDAHRRSTGQIAAAARDLIARAQARQLQLHEMQGATFTLTNLGMYGIDAFTPIINLPQCAILGVGRILAKPAVVDDQIVPRKLVTLSLTFDHRVVDGGPAARFLNTVREFITEPALWMME